LHYTKIMQSLNSQRRVPKHCAVRPFVPHPIWSQTQAMSLARRAEVDNRTALKYLACLPVDERCAERLEAVLAKWGQQ
jgi:hypothetical protein